MKILAAKLAERARESGVREMEVLAGEQREVAWAARPLLRLHPYQMVKDLRTDHEVGNIGAGPRRRPRRFHESWLALRQRQRA